MSAVDPAEGRAGGSRRGGAGLPIQRYLSWMLAAVAVPILVLTALVAWRYVEAQREQFQGEVSAAAQVVQAVADRELIGLTDTLRALATSPALQAGNVEGFHRQAVEVSRVLNATIVLRSLGGQQLVNSRLPWGQVLPDASMVAPWDAAALASVRAVVTDHYIGLVGSTHSIALLTTVRRDGEPAYLLHLGIAAERLRDALLQMGFAEGRVGMLLDGKAVVLARSLNHEQAVGTQSLLSAHLLAAPPRSRGVYVNREGLGVFWAARVSPLTGLIAVAEAPTELLAVQQRRALAATGVAALLLLGLSLVAAHLFSQPLDRALRRLAQAGSALGLRERVTAEPEGIREVAEVRQALARASTDLAEHEASRELVLHELNHRVKNTLATIRALAALSAREGGDAEAFRRRLTEKIDGLARAHDLLVRRGGGKVQLREVFETELGIHDRAGGGRILLSGPEIVLPATAVHALGMLVHELATNAAKYGALSTDTGKVEVAWSVVATEAKGVRRLHLHWTETGGPTVKAPLRYGFGTRLIERGLARQLRADVGTTYAPEGLRFSMSMPVDDEEVRKTELGV
jgi:two-component sensor histidine kinase